MKKSTSIPGSIGRAVLLLSATLVVPAMAVAQTKPAVLSPSASTVDESVAGQLRASRAKVAELEAALRARAAANPGAPDAAVMPANDKKMGAMSGSGSPPAPMPGMPAGGSAAPASMGMGMMEGEMAGMGSMSPAAPGGAMPGKDAGMMSMMGMMGMAPASAAGGMAMPTALPGFPGESHLYHIGSTGFFLDHGEHITLTTEQQTSLNAAKEKAMLDQATKQREIDAAEQELWTLTASDRPDATKIETQVRAIEKLRGDQRLAFVRAVGDSAKLLTDTQRQSLLGQLPPQTRTSPSDPPATPPSPDSMPAKPAGGMPGM